MGFLVDILTQGFLAGALGVFLLSMPIFRRRKNLDEKSEY
jgi:hypothetical protein